MKNYGNTIYWKIMEGNPLTFVVGIFYFEFQLPYFELVYKIIKLFNKLQTM